jgi:hypothetical protein
MNYKNFLNLIFFTIILIFLNSCGVKEKVKNIYKPVDLTKEPLDPDARAQKNIKEGRGISIGNLGNKNTNYEFSTSNPLWRATLDSIDFMPLSTIDYSGGIIISDWYTDNNNSKESIKIIIRFMSNEIQANSLKIQVFKKNCAVDLNCNTQQIKSSISQELAKVILNKAAILDKDLKSNKK